MGTHPSVFLSFAREDRELAVQLAKTLQDAGVFVRWPDTEVQAGDRWADAVKSAINDSDLILFIPPSEGEVRSNFAFFELGMARALKKRVVPVVRDARGAANIANLSDSSFFADSQWLSAGDLPDLVDEVRAQLADSKASSAENLPPQP